MPLAFGIPIWETLAQQKTCQSVDVMLGYGHFMSIFDIDVHIIVGFHKVWDIFRRVYVPPQYFKNLCGQGSI